MLPRGSSTVELEELQIALRHLQNFEPAGVGARTPGECLALQLRALPGRRRYRAARARRSSSKHLELLAARDYTRLKKR